MKKNFLRKLISTTLAFALSTSLLIGCESKSNSVAKAGTYTATEKGFGGDVTVNLTISEDGKISSIDVNADSETPTIGGEAAPKLAKTIVDTQSLAIDTVSGATYTSTAVINAVTAALTEAGADIDAFKNNEISKNGENEEVNVDVVVVGAGGSGTAAALAATEAGLNVLIVEKNPSAGGNSKIASGFFAIGTELQKSEGLNLSVDKAVQDLMEFNQYLSNGTIVRKIVENAADTVEWLQGYGVEFYLPETTTQAAHEDDPYKWKTYHKFVDQAQAFENMYTNLENMGAKVVYNTSLDTIMKNSDGVVTGITATKEDGGILTVNANATIICTGGFGANEEKTSAALNSNLFNSLGMPNNGEGIEAIEAIGGFDLDGTPLLHACQFAESTVKQDSAGENLAGFSDTSLTQILNSPLLWVDITGSRFTNEDVVYDTAFWANAAYTVGGKYYIIVDKATLEDFSKGTSLTVSQAGPGAKMDLDDFVKLADQSVEAGTAFKGSTLEELAEATGMNADDLKATVERYNSMVEKGSDTDYGKASSSLAYKVESGDYYAFDVRGVFLGTVGGVKVDDNMQVMTTDFELIPGLYAAGTTAGGYYTGVGYPPYEGLACGFAYTSGRIAGTSAVEYVNSIK
ncbi:FAD-dependent oxidoreductase [Clostridium sp. Sa3CUN1]|uniref:Urocanate reductase n=1 Tax=Clostridium gallinarum TaxID=2762246 RepID=A0ABR8Q1X8_9CLOT|nr:FAD-dependent oxidoreductase [Clostridium gallinarum]MBD7914433.1 FAD-dependent oxidoreductase [Clostridium gallinarum]